MKRTLILVALFTFLIQILFAQQEIPQNERKETHHPFLIVKKDMYPALKEKMNQEPWKSMKDDAISRSGKAANTEAYDLQYFVGAAALAYILDEPNAQSHANRVRDAILIQYSKLDVTEKRDWGGVVPNMSSFFVAILALDIVYDALTFEEIQDCEKVISDQIFKVGRSGSWGDARRGTHGTWDIYKDDRTKPDDLYYNGILAQITPDGVSPVTNHYAWERVGGGDSRVSKSGYMDVLEFTGIDNRYYNNERIQKFQRWLFGSSLNCAKEMAIFGDMFPTQGLSNDMLHRRVVNFDMEAAGYAAWFHEGTPAIGHILTYILPKQALSEPVVPSSKIYENGGAFFRDKEADSNGLQAVLYNIKSQDDWHTHFEVNGLSLSGLGNRLLVNGGRLGEPTRAAYLNNTLTINGENHISRIGGGITSGFTSDQLDFAVGFSGSALNEKHNRNLIFLHSEKEVNGYFIVFDEVETNIDNKVKNYFHPANQTTVSVEKLDKEYLAPIDHYPTLNGTNLAFYFVTQPKEVTIEKSKSAAPGRYRGYPDHNRLEAVYDVDSIGAINITTILFPYNSTKLKAVFQEIQGNVFNGCKTIQGSTIDYILEPFESKSVEYEKISFQGKFIITREEQNETIFYLVKDGKYFSSGIMGFESDTPVTFFNHQNNGVIISKGAKVKIKGKDFGGIKFDNTVQILTSGDDFIEVQIPPGKINFYK